MLDRVRRAARVRHYSPRTEHCYVEWIIRYIRFHGHPNTMGGAGIEMFLTDLAVRGQVSASTQNQAFNALLFLYQQVLGITDRIFKGVWFSDIPLDINEEANGDTILALEISEDLFAEYEWVEEGKTYREALIPAALVNQYGRPRVFDHG